MHVSIWLVYFSISQILQQSTVKTTVGISVEYVRLRRGNCRHGHLGLIKYPAPKKDADNEVLLSY